MIVILADNMVHPVNFIPVIIILCREILVSGLREFLAEVHVGMPVTRLAKWKTGFQMTALSMILVGYMFHNLGVILLWVAAVLTFVTGYQYFQKSLDYVKSVEAAKIRSWPMLRKRLKKLRRWLKKPRPASKNDMPKKFWRKKPLKD